MQLKGTVAIVTGGNGGLGQRICHALARAGCDIAVVYAQSHDGARSSLTSCVPRACAPRRSPAT